MCTRILFNGKHSTLTARTFDYPESSNPKVIFFPKGISREGKVDTPVQWVSKYSSIVTSAYDVFTMDGVNDHGFSCHFQNFKDSVLPEISSKKKGIRITQVSQYLLDNSSTVNQAIELIKRLNVEPVKLPEHLPGDYVKMHLAIEDKSGDSAIIQFVEGKIKIYHDRKFTVMTNDPEYSKLLELKGNLDLNDINFNTKLPGNVLSTERFIRASAFLSLINQDSNSEIVFSAILAIARNVSIPFGTPYPGFGTYDTQYRTVINHNTKQYFWENSRSINIFYFDLNDFQHTTECFYINPLDKNLTGNVSNKLLPINQLY